ncbi:MAG: hypothetical protein ACK5P7_09375 [Bdellovibrio sp.]|jgi:hypothetical protein
MALEATTLRETSLLGKNLDLLMVGGLSLFLFLCFHFFLNENADTTKLAILMYYLSLVINWPHFMLSYQLLYWDKRTELVKKPTYLWAAIIAPIILIGVFGLGFSRNDDVVFSLMVHVMFLTVGWHYVKQVFGTIVVTSSVKSFYLSKLERYALLTNLYSIWGLSFVGGQLDHREADFFGIKYDLLGFSPKILLAAYALVFVTGVIAVGLLVWRYIREGRSISRVGWVSYVALLAWYLPFAGHRHFYYMVPFFHSLQYLLFVGALKKNQWGATALRPTDFERRKSLFFNGLLYFGAAIVTGLLVFHWIPTGLDERMPEWNANAAVLWSPTIFMGVFQLFINIHHYFIDNVLWRSDNADLKKYLFQKP